MPWLRFSIVPVTDDPWAEIAARTWIDQYGTLDLKGLMDKPYDEWLNQNPQKPEIAEAVNKLNGPFMPNERWEYARNRSKQTYEEVSYFPTHWSTISWQV